MQQENTQKNLDTVCERLLQTGHSFDLDTIIDIVHKSDQYNAVKLTDFVIDNSMFLFTLKSSKNAFSSLIPYLGTMSNIWRLVEKLKKDNIFSLGVFGGFLFSPAFGGEFKVKDFNLFEFISKLQSDFKNAENIIMIINYLVKIIKASNDKNSANLFGVIIAEMSEDAFETNTDNPGAAYLRQEVILLELEEFTGDISLSIALFKLTGDDGYLPEQAREIFVF